MKEPTVKTKDVECVAKVLTVLDVLMRNFAHGFSSTELSRETGISMSALTRYVATLENAGFAERIQETGRIRPSHRHARYAVQIMNSLASAEQQLDQTKNRLYGGQEAQTRQSMKRINEE
jgi:DNA-binding IclR family transcriptional regulator